MSRKDSKINAAVVDTFSEPSKIKLARAEINRQKIPVNLNQHPEKLNPFHKSDLLKLGACVY